MVGQVNKGDGEMMVSPKNGSGCLLSKQVKCSEHPSLGTWDVLTDKRDQIIDLMENRKRALNPRFGKYFENFI